MSNREHNQPSLSALSFILRHRDMWPSEFSLWNYGSCATCAMGLAQVLWPQQIHEPCTDEMVKAFGIDHAAADSIFTLLGNSVPGHVTPEIVADRIDQLLETLSSGLCEELFRI